MKTRGMVLAAGALLGLSGAAMAQFSAGGAGPFNSFGAIGDPANGIFTFNYAGADFQVGDITLTGTLTSGDIGSWLSEARYRVTTPGGMTFSSGSVATGTGWTGDIAVNNTQNANTLGIGGAGVWTFEFFENYDDTSGSGLDAIWSNINFNVGVGVPPPPPPPVFSGSFVGTPNVLTNGVSVNGSTIWTGVESGLTDGAGEGAYAYSAPHQYTEVGNEVAYRIDHSGGDLQVDLVGLSTDLDLILIDSSGLPTGVLASSASTGDEQVLLAAAAPGVYYAVVDSYGTTNIGSNYTITYIPAPGALALMGLGGLVAARRRR